MTQATSGAMPLWEVLIRPRNGLSHKHAGSLHAADEVMALQAARDVYTRRGEGNSIWVVRSADIVASDPVQAGENLNRPPIRFIATRPFTRYPKMWGICDGGF